MQQRSLKSLPLTTNQILYLIEKPKNVVLIGGRGTGKSNLLGLLFRRFETMPGCIGNLTSVSYKFLMSNILPAIFSMMRNMNYHRDIDYCYGVNPPKKWGIKMPYNMPFDVEHFFTFRNPDHDRMFGIQLTSMERGGVAGRGPSYDYLAIEEIQDLDWDTLDATVFKTKRGNLNKGFNPDLHTGFHLTGTMPYEKSLRDKLMNMGEYYMTEFKINYFEYWKEITNKQLLLLQIDEKENQKEWISLYNEIQRLKQIIVPRKSKDGTLFMLTNAFDNKFVGYDYIKEQYRLTATPMIFNVEMLNMIVEQVDENYYHLEAKHEQKNLFNNQYIQSKGEKFASEDPSSLVDSDCIAQFPLILGWDLGGFNCLVVAQHHQGVNEMRILNEFFVKLPDQSLKQLIQKFLWYYRNHGNKKVVFIKDTYGDNRTSPYNKDLINWLQEAGWHVDIKVHEGREISAKEKYYFVNKVLQEDDDKLPKVRINITNCKNLIISMKQTKVVERDEKLSKNKASEHNKSTPQENATHFTDAFDKLLYTYWKRFVTDNDRVSSFGVK